MTTALVLVDIQNDYFPGGTMSLENMDAAAANAARLLAAFRERRLPIVHVRHLSVRPGATFFVPGTAGAEIHPAVAPRAGEAVVEKNFPNAFRATDLEPRLRAAGVDHVVIAGAMSHMCIDATTRAAFDHGFKCTVAEDACATRRPRVRRPDLARPRRACRLHGGASSALREDRPGRRVRRRASRGSVNAAHQDPQEIPMQMDANPLLDFSGLPRFAAVKPEHITPAIDQLLAENRALIDELTRAETPATWADFVQPLEDANERLARAWGVVGHLHGVLDSPELREAYNANLPKIVQYYDRARAEPGAVRQVQGAAAPRRNSPRSRARTAQDRRQRDPRLPPLRRRTAPTTRSSALPRSRRNWRQLGDEVLREPARRDQRVRGACRGARRRSRACPTTCSKPRARPRRRTASPAGSSRCRRRPTCRSCSTPTTARCASACTAPTSRAPSEFGKPELRQHAADRAHARAAPGGGAAARLRRASPKCRWCRRWPSRRAQVLALPATTWRPGRVPFAAARHRPSCATSRATSSGSTDLEAWDLAYASERLRAGALRVLRRRR